MECEWLITNLNHETVGDLNLKLNKSQFNFYHKGEGLNTFTYKGDKITLLIDGFILPRVNLGKFSEIKSDLMIKELYKKYGLKFINYIKGNFTIILFINNRFYVFNDRMGIKKFFYFCNSKFLISNKFKLVVMNSECEVDYENLAIYSLMNQFIDGSTIFKNIFYSKPSLNIYFENGLNVDSYWHCKKLLNLENIDMSYKDFSESFLTIIDSYIKYLNPENISLTLTGGLDSRTILAVLLNLGIKPKTFSYGHSDSFDVVIAKKISQKCGLIYKNYDYKPTTDSFADFAEYIIDKGNSLVHFHRAHRLFAIKKPENKKMDSEILFGGYLGGEMIRYLIHDGLIISNFIKSWFKSRSKKKDLVVDFLKTNYFRVDFLNIDRILNSLEAQDFFKNKAKLNNFFLSFQIASHYHSQDINLFCYFNKWVSPIYFDIDILELIFGSKFNSFFTNASHENYIKRFNSNELQCHLINQLCPPLATIPLARRGTFTPKDLVQNSKIVYFTKRIFSEIISSKKYHANFSISKPIIEYFNEEIQNHCDSELSRTIIDWDLLKNDFYTKDHINTETYWRKFTNPIFFLKLLDFYKKTV